MMRSLTTTVLVIGCVLSHVAHAGCQKSTCNIVAIDSSRRDAVYDLERYLKKESNAHAVKEIIENEMSDVKVTTRITNQHEMMSLLANVRSSECDLVILHTSSFFHSDINTTVDDLIKAIDFLAKNRGTKILVYGSNYAPVGGMENLLRVVLNRTSAHNEQLAFIVIPRTFESEQTRAILLEATKGMLGIK